MQKPRGSEGQQETNKHAHVQKTNEASKSLAPSEALDEMEKNEYSVVWKDKSKTTFPLPVGTQFRITTAGLTALPVEVRAAKIDPVTSKCGKGRPRRFPAGVVYRLLGETAPDPSDYSAAPVAAPVAAYDPDGVNHDVLILDPRDNSPDDLMVAKESVEQTPVPQKSEEERAAQDARVAGLLGLIGDKNPSADW